MTADAASASVRPDALTSAGIDESTISVFQQGWWIDIARGTKIVHEARVLKEGIVVGSLPYVIGRSRSGVRWGACPYWSHLGGPVVSPSLSEQERSEVFARLVEQLPRRISFGFSCPPHAVDREPRRQAFVDAGFQHAIELTYSQSPDKSNVTERVSRKQRMRINSAARRLDIVDIPRDDFIQFYSANLAGSGLKSNAPLCVADALIAQGSERDPPQVRVMAARSKRPDAPFDAAIACAWDDVRYYLWMSTRRRPTPDAPDDKPHPDAIKLLIVHAMLHARDLGLVFDADGCTTPGAKALYRDVLRIPNEELRDVFERTTRLARWYRVQVPRLQRLAGVFSARA